jgi:hypothetical protein
MILLERIRTTVDLQNYDASLNLVHLENVFLGYMATVQDKEEADCPFHVGGASYGSWQTGAKWAREDLDLEDPEED